MFLCLLSGDSGSFLLFAPDVNSSCRNSELELLFIGLGIIFYGGVRFTSQEVDYMEGRPELELLVEDGILQEDGNESVHFNTLSLVE